MKKAQLWAFMLLAFAVPSASAIVVMPPSPATRGFLESEGFLLLEDYTYEIGDSGKVITVPAGFVTDFASIPFPVRGILPSQGYYSRGAVIHDFLYWSQLCTREQADNLLWIAMKESDVPAWKRQAVYWGVNIGGDSAWDDNARARKANVPRVVPAAHYGLVHKMTWKAARRKLIADRVTDPLFKVDPRACKLGDARVVPKS